MKKDKNQNNNEKKVNPVVKGVDTGMSLTLRVTGLVFKGLLTFILIILTTTLLLGCIFAFYVKTCLNTELEVSLSDFNLSLSSTILYQEDDGSWQELVTLSSTENRVWVDYEDIPQAMIDALVSIEDQRFYEHKGVDWYRTVAAFVNMFITMDNNFGGSTITQQLIKNLTQQDDVTVTRKLLEIFQALEFEENYSKEEILEWYLNAVYFGEGCYGIYTAAQTYFDKDLSELSVAECASIISITNNPSYYNPFISVDNNKDRQETVLYKMYELGYIETEEDYQAALNEELQFVRSETEEYEQEIYSYYVEVVINDVLEDLMDRKGVSYDTAVTMLYSGGYRIYSCIDLDIQACVDAVYEDVDNLPKSYVSSDQQMQSAIVIMDPYTGEIVALSGGVGEKTINFGLNRVYSQRAPGSSLKPLAVYGPALEYGLITQNTLVNDSADITLSGTYWYPTNSGGGNSGIVTIRTALASSLNTVAAQIIDKLGVNNSFEYLTEKLGFTTLVDDDNNYAPLSLGELTYGATVREMAQAYCSFVNDGILTESHTYTHITDANGNMVLDNTPSTSVAWSENTADNITNMLQNAVASGTGSEAWMSNMPVAGKTGTSSDNWNRWFVGMTPYYVAAVWTGYDTNESMYFYGNPAAQIWKRVMEPVHNGLDYVSFDYPSYIGSDTQLFGDLTEALYEQLNPSPSPTVEPTVEPTEEPTVEPSTEVTVSPSETVSPTETLTPTDDLTADEDETEDSLDNEIPVYEEIPVPTTEVQ